MTASDHGQSGVGGESSAGAGAPRHYELSLHTVSALIVLHTQGGISDR